MSLSLIFTNGLGPTAYTVAASDTPAGLKARADRTCDGTNDHVEIQAQLDAASSAGGGLVMLAPGTYTLGDEVSIPASCGLVGVGRRGTTVQAGGGYTGTLISLGARSILAHLDVVTPSGQTEDAIVAASATDALITNLELTGGKATGALADAPFALKVTNPFMVRIDHVRVQAACNGVAIWYASGTVNYGNSVITAVEVQPQAAARIAWDIRGSESSQYQVNLMHFDYCGGVFTGGNGAGSIGLRIRNAPFLAFTMADLEGADDSLIIESESGTSSPAASNNLTFIGGYMDNDVEIPSNANRITFIGTRFGVGAVTNASSTAVFTNCTNPPA